MPAHFAVQAASAALFSAVELLAAAPATAKRVGHNELPLPVPQLPPRLTPPPLPQAPSCSYGSSGRAGV